MTGVSGLAHVAIRCRDLDASARFYADVLGLHEGPRPDFGFPGRWLYAKNGAAIVHLFGADDAAARRFTGSVSDGGAAVDHIAFVATDWEAVRERLQTFGVAYQVQNATGADERQVFLQAPDSVTIELAFDRRKFSGD